jgi:hypothetical protein
MSITLPRFLTAAVLGAALIAPVSVMSIPARAADQVYHDRDRNEDHHWDTREDHAYRMWVKENHMKYRAFSKLKDEDQQRYWTWRHEHSDDQLKHEHH